MLRRRPLLAATLLAALAVLFAGLAAGSLVARSTSATASAGPPSRAGAVDAVLPVAPALRTGNARPLRFVHRAGPLLVGVAVLAAFGLALLWLVDGGPAPSRRLDLGDRGRPRAPPLPI